MKKYRAYKNWERIEADTLNTSIARPSSTGTTAGISTCSCPERSLPAEAGRGEQIKTKNPTLTGRIFCFKI